jgi:hypothetical protein
MNVTPESSYDAASLTHTIVRWLGSMEILRPDYRIVAAAAAVVVGRRWIDSMSLSALEPASIPVSKNRAVKARTTIDANSCVPPTPATPEVEEVSKLYYSDR